MLREHRTSRWILFHLLGLAHLIKNLRKLVRP